MILTLFTLVLALLLRGLGALGVRALADGRAATRAAMGLFFCATGTGHFLGVRADLIAMVPPGFPDPALLVTLSGLAELAGGIGLLLPATARLAGPALILLLVVIFPANVHAAREGLLVAGYRHPGLAERGLMQLVWIGMLWWSRPRSRR